MPDAEHSFYSASNSDMWLNCPPSAKLNAKYPNKGSVYTAEGTDAHTLLEYKELRALGREAEDPTANLIFFNKEMDYNTDNACAYVMDRFAECQNKCSDTDILIEQKLDLNEWMPGAFGTADVVIISEPRMIVCDFKYGARHLVEAFENPQMMIYALGSLRLFDDIYNIEEIEMVIYQPRRENISSWTISKTDLLKWAEDVLRPGALLASKGEGEFKAGSHCLFCRCKAGCRARAEYNLELAKYDFEAPPLLSDLEVAAILEKADSLVSWVSDVKEHALACALSGKTYSGFKLVEGRSVRKYVDEEAVADAVKAAGFDPYEKKILSITAMGAMLGKTKFDAILGSLIHKPQGKPTLVPVTDKRPAITSAGQDFI